MPKPIRITLFFFSLSSFPSFSSSLALSTLFVLSVPLLSPHPNTHTHLHTKPCTPSPQPSCPPRNAATRCPPHLDSLTAIPAKTAQSIRFSQVSSSAPRRLKQKKHDIQIRSDHWVAAIQPGCSRCVGKRKRPTLFLSHFFSPLPHLSLLRVYGLAPNKLRCSVIN